MCDPLTIGSAVVTAAGTYMQYQSQQKAQDRVQQAISNNAEAQEKLRRESQGQVMDASDKFSRENFDKTQAEETGKIQQKLRDNLSQGVLPGEYYGGRQDENTQKYQAEKTGKTNQFSQGIADALANLRGFDAGMRTTGTGINRAGEHVVMNNGFMDGNNAVLPIQIEAAKQSAANPLADIMVGIGGAGLSAGLSSATPGLLDSQGSFSRTLSGMGKNVQGPVNGFAGTGFNLV